MFEPNGEVLWPLETAADAINELTDSGYRVLGLDARERDDLGLGTEIPLFACHEDATRDRACWTRWRRSTEPRQSQDGLLPTS